MQSKLGERPATLEARAKGLNLSKQTADDPANAALRTIRTEAYMFLGDAYVPKA